MIHGRLTYLYAGAYKTRRNEGFLPDDKKAPSSLQGIHQFPDIPHATKKPCPASSQCVFLLNFFIKSFGIRKKMWIFGDNC